MKNYVKKHKGHDVPDGAEKFLAFHHFLDQPDRHEFYRWVGDSPEYFDYDDKKWAVISSKANYDKAIELPEQDLPNWDEQKDLNAVWIEDKEPDRICDLSDWYELFGEYYRNLSDSYKIEKGSDMITVHKRPIAIANTPNWDDAPEWADGVALAPWNNDLMLWFNGDKYQYIDALKTDSVYAMEDDNFIEYHMKRPIAIEDKEWDGKGSKVGKRVRATAVSSNEWENCLVKFCDKHSDIVVVRFDGHSEDTPLRLPWRFLPLKTAEELEREAFIEDGLNIVMKLKSLINPNEGVLSLALYGLFDAGFTAPKN